MPASRSARPSAARPAVLVRRARLALAALVPLLAAGACGRREVPAPVRGAPAALAPLPPAVLALPITIQTSALVAQLDRAIPRADSLDRAACQSMGGMVCHQYVYRRDTLAITATGDRLDVLARVRYRGRVALPTGGSVGSCGFAPEAMPRAELRFSTALYWRSDWRLATRSTALTTALPDPCQVTLLRVDATPLMRRIADWQLGRLARQVDSLVPATADLRRPADSLWRVLQEPVPVDSAGTAWLLMSPESVGLAPIEGRGGSLRTGVTITARPRIVTGARPRVTVRPLPATLTLARPASGLRVPVQIELPFAEVARRAAQLLAAETRGQPLRVTGVDVWGAGDTAVVKLTLVGQLNGDLFLVGRPRWDAAARTVVVDDLGYTVESRGVLSRLKATLGAPLIARALDQATNGGTLAVGEQLDALRRELTQQLNRPLAPDVAVGGGVRDLRVTAVHVGVDAFVVRVLLEGEAGLWAR